MTKPAQTVWLKPSSPELLVPYPGRTRRMLPPDGARVRLSTWWRCRILAGHGSVGLRRLRRRVGWGSCVRALLKNM